MKHIDTLSKIDLFEGIQDKTLTEVALISEERTYAKGRLVFTEGSKAEHVYILLSGEVDIQVNLTSNRGDVSVAVVNTPYKGFGWSGIVPPYHFTASALCNTECRVIAIHGEKLIQILRRSPAHGFIVMQRIATLIGSRLRNSRIALLKTL